ncbi:Mitochondrial import inner membrane translocase subunit tim23 [Escovopsis weberi]|uniref:Mitochondrial import inner membrane translocase subunit tim23 n=1 Tax=Escovopsis weberi TaxID=150374 RepID=A0A0M9VUC0_ESCWE|nr:Mitochondrial import inner membrane translocase subunit tim23 [Escovopsis weberi]
MSSLWNALTGGGKAAAAHQQNKPQQQQQQQSLPSASATLAEPAVNPYDPTQGQGVEAFLQNSTFSDPSQLHPLAGLNKDTLEYLALEDSVLSDLPGGQSVLPSRGFTDDLCYGTGVTYLAALTVGGAWGFQEGLRRSRGQPAKLRLNAVLNGMTRRGPFLGNSAGVVAITYNCVNSLIGWARGRHDAFNTVAAGALSGMLFKSTRGFRPMMISGGLVASVAGVWAVVRRSFFPIPETHAEKQL